MRTQGKGKAGSVKGVVGFWPSGPRRDVRVAGKRGVSGRLAVGLVYGITTTGGGLVGVFLVVTTCLGGVGWAS